MRKILFIFLTALIALPSMAQKSKADRREERKERINALVKQEEEGVVTYRKHTVCGLKLLTDGYGAFIEIGRAKSIRKSLLFQLEASVHKHPKEEKETSIDASSTPFVYGKLNFFYNVKLGVQQQFLIANKANRNGVNITGNIGGGISVGLLRPYYEELQFGGIGGPTKFIKYSPADSAEFLTGSIAGGPPIFGRGWDELTVVPGLYAKAAARFDYGHYNELVNAVEVGVVAEGYSKKIPQLLFVKEKQFFFSAFVTIMIGKRK